MIASQPSRRVSKVGSFTILTDVSHLPRAVVTTVVKEEDALIREMSRYLKDDELAEGPDLQVWVDQQHFGLVEQLEDTHGRRVRVECPSCRVTITVRAPATQGEGAHPFLLVSCGTCRHGFVVGADALVEAPAIEPEAAPDELREEVVRVVGPVAAAAPAMVEPDAQPEHAPHPDEVEAAMAEAAGFSDLDLELDEVEGAGGGAAVEVAWAMAAPPVHLRVLEGKDQGTVFALDRPTLSIGRGGADIVINDLRISRRHAEIEVRREVGTVAFYLRDLGSTNGTFLNEDRVVQSHRLEQGDRIRIGKTIAEMMIDPEGLDSWLSSGFFGELEDEDEPAAGTSAKANLHETKIYLDVIDGEDKGRSYEFSRERVLLGRGDANVVLNDSKVSRRHAEIELVGGYTPLLRDLTSANGTFVNGKRIDDAVELKDGDRIRIGDTVVKFSILRSL